jgi:NDP-sugar pyrophosphorylase family protein
MSRKAVVLSGGLGKRLRPFTEVIPKPLMPIGEKAILEIQIEHFRKFGFDEIYLATNYKSDYVENFFGDGSRYGVHLEVSKESKPLGTAGPVRLLADKLSKDPFVVINGDILSLVDFQKMYDFASNKDSLLTVGVKKVITPYAFGNIFFEGDHVTNIEEKPNMVTFALAGIYVMKPGIFEHIPPDIYFGMDNLIKDMLQHKLTICKYEIEEYWLDIGQIDDYEKAQNAYKEMYGGIK